MLNAVFAAALALGALQQNTDTTFAAGSATRISVEAMTGSVTVRAWDRADVRIRAVHESSTELEIRNRGGRVTVEVGGTWGAPGNARMDIMVPRSFAVELEGMTFPMTVEGTRGGVSVANMQGDILIRNVAGSVSAESMSGGVTIDGARGSLEISAVNQNIQLTNVQGRIEAEAVNGSIVVRNADSNHSTLSTVNGYVEYQGVLHEGGQYHLGTHNGRITMAVPASANARFNVTASSGQVEAAFPVPVDIKRGGTASFTLGAGSARVEIETYNGTIHLIRPGSR